MWPLWKPNKIWRMTVNYEVLNLVRLLIHAVLLSFTNLKNKATLIWSQCYYKMDQDVFIFTGKGLSWAFIKSFYTREICIASQFAMVW